MPGVRHSAWTRTFVVPLTLVCFLGACYKHTQIEPPYAAAMEESQPKQLRITIGEDSTFTVKEPRIEGEIIVGESSPCRSAPYVGAPCESSFAVSEITRLEDRDKDGLATGFLIGGLSVVGIGIGLGIAYAIACEGGACS